VKQGQLPAPGRDGLYDRDQALRAFRVKPLDRVRRGKRPSVTARLGRETAWPTPTGKDRSRSRAPEPEQGLRDPDTRFRLARARQEEIKLRRMQNQVVDLKAAQRRAFHIARMWRDIQDAAVSREAPLMAARLGIDEGVAWRELKGFMRGVQRACDRLDVGKALATGPADDGETGEERDERTGNDEP
jgi:hypothetical protein